MDIPEEYSRKDLRVVRGLPVINAFADNWERVDQFQVYQDDLVIASYPKSGTELLSQIPSPRLLRTHLPITHLPKSFWENKCKIVYVARNAKDVAVSSYHYSLANILPPEPGTFAQYLEDFIAGNVSFGSWYEHVNGWWLKRNELRVLYLFYEDMKEDLQREIQKLLTFLEKDIDEEVLKKIVHHASFEVMKDNPMTNYKAAVIDLMDHTVSPFMRKGISGDWKNHFTVAQNERFDEDYAEKMEGSSLSFDMEA
ncbi:sulfotransferase 1B1-like isoform X2 [Lissotriton helveticus]